MKLFTVASLVATAAAAADPQITPAPAQLQVRQNSDPAFVGWVSASTFTDQRSCDYPATLSRSGSLAQCCSGSSCVFWSSCSAGTLFASQTSLFCDQGYCNTAVLVPTVGASSGQSYLGCWATSLGQSPFTLVNNIGSAPIGSKTGSISGSMSFSSGSRASAPTPAASGSGSGSSTQSTTSATSSTNVAALADAQPLTGIVGLLAVFLGMI